jgi:hypothetical protein
MRRLRALVFVLPIMLLFGAGCTSDADKAQWAEFWKDARGDNMEMGSHRDIPPMTRPDP